MKFTSVFSIRTFVLAAFVAATGLASTHTASAQVYSRNTSADYQLQSGGYTTVNAVILGNSGAFTLLGQQSFANGSSQPVFVYCWVSTVAGSTTTVPYGPVSSATIPAGGWGTLPLNGFYTAGATELYVVCRASNATGSIVSGAGNITAAYVP